VLMLYPVTHTPHTDTHTRTLLPLPPIHTHSSPPGKAKRSKAVSSAAFGKLEKTVAELEEKHKKLEKECTELMSECGPGEKTRRTRSVGRRVRAVGAEG
jgi:hypothetical protein